MSVTRSFRKRGIGEKMLDVALSHCVRQQFRAVELITTEAHHEAKNLYVKKGFDILHSFIKIYALGFVRVTLYRFRMPCVLKRSTFHES